METWRDWEFLVWLVLSGVAFFAVCEIADQIRRIR